MVRTRNRVLIVAAAGEIVTGVALLVAPSAVAGLLLGAPLEGLAVAIAAVAGIALVGLGVACWPGTPRSGMLTYSAGVTLYLAYLGLTGNASGVLLWPAVILHAALTALLVRAAPWT